MSARGAPPSGETTHSAPPRPKTMPAWLHAIPPVTSAPDVRSFRCWSASGDARDQPRAVDDRHALAVGREDDAIRATAWQRDRLGTIEPSDEGTAHAVEHTDHRHGAAVGRDGRPERAGRAGFHIAWVPDLDVRHWQAGCAGARRAPERPPSQQYGSCGDSPRQRAPHRAHRCWRGTSGRFARALQIQPRIADVAQPLTGILDEASRDQRADTFGHRGWQQRQVRLAREDQPQRFRHRIGREEALARQHLVQHHTERPDIRALVHRLAARLLRTHVGGSTRESFRLGHRGCRERRRHRHVGRRTARSRQRFRQPEVQNLHRAVGADLDVRGLEIAMDDALLVRRFERLRQSASRAAGLRRSVAGRVRCAATGPRPRPIP